MIQDRFLAPLLAGESAGGTPLLRLLDRCPVLQGVTAYLIGIGIRLEHVRQRPRPGSIGGR
jgi:hypothetical protein